MWIAGLLFAAAHCSPAAAQVGESVAAVEPGGPGVLTKCRNWLVTISCHTYHHIALPPQIAVGDRIPLEFGSHTKTYAFPVVRIELKGRQCVILSEADGNPREIDKIEVAPCHPADGGH